MATHLWNYKVKTYIKFTLVFIQKSYQTVTYLQTVLSFKLTQIKRELSLLPLSNKIQCWHIYYFLTTNICAATCTLVIKPIFHYDFVQIAVMKINIYGKIVISQHSIKRDSSTEHGHPNHIFNINNPMVLQQNYTENC